MVIQHGIRPDGQKATPKDYERIKAWDRAGRGCAAKPTAAADAPTEAAKKTYKSAEFVPTNNDSSDTDTAAKVQVESKVELPPQRKKRPREDHAGRDATPPRRTSPRRAVATEEKKPRVSPTEPPSTAPAPPPVISIHYRIKDDRAPPRKVKRRPPNPPPWARHRKRVQRSN